MAVNDLDSLKSDDTKKPAAKKTAAKKTAAKKPAAKKTAAKKSAASRRKAAVELSGIDAVADRVLRGAFGSGRERDILLAKAGHNPDEVRKAVYRLRGERIKNNS